MKTNTNEKINAVNENLETELTETDLEQVSGGYIAYHVDRITSYAGQVVNANPFGVSVVNFSGWNSICKSGIRF